MFQKWNVEQPSEEERGVFVEKKKSGENYKRHYEERPEDYSILKSIKDWINSRFIVL